jgi:two-component system phosphate regulon sensor histidine kinase PhoR
MAWIIAFIAAALAFSWWWSHRRSVRELAELEPLVASLTDGTTPELPPLRPGSPFARLADRLHQAATAQLRLREQTSREEFNFRTILSSMEEGVMLVDELHVVRLVNSSFVQLFGPRADPVGETLLAVLRDAAFAEIAAAALATGEPQEREVATNGSRSTRHFGVNAVPMRDSAGQKGVVMIFRDISRLKQLEDVRREFVANVSHELRTPLSIFHGYLETILDSPELPSEELLPILHVMRKHSLRLNALLEDLLILARLESRDERLHLERVDVPGLVGEIVGDWELQCAQKRITIKIDCGAELPTMMADRLRMEQVLNNLIGNAIKYANQGGHVFVRVRRMGEVLDLRVEDDGMGIPPADLPHIFERFYRADKARTREQGGTGLGLSIVKHIVQSHGGSVRAESTYGKGTSIILQLPLGDAEEELI